MLGVVSGRAFRLVALALLSLLQVAWFISSVPLSLKAGVAALLALAIVRPGWALLVWAGVAPLTTSLAGLAGATVPGAQLLEAMTIALLLGSLARYGTGPPTRLALPALLMSVVAVASGLAELPARFVTTSPDHSASAGMIAPLLFQHAVDRIFALDPWYFALLIVEGAALAWMTERLIRRDPDLAPRLIWCALAGHAGVALLNLTRLIAASLRGGEFPASLPGLFLSIREYTQYDVNAAASILVMVILAGFGLAYRRARLPVIVAITLVAVALWIAGSRVAMASLLITSTGVLLVRARHSARLLGIASGALLASAAVITWLVAGYPSGRNLNLPTSIASRAVLFRAALGMTRDAPVLGVGAGTFLEESPNYGSEALAPLVYDGRTRDNAHNYFLQTLAEQGIAGLIALLAMLGAALVPALRPSQRRDVLLTWLAAGVIACILTWMTGHPLLLAEAAFMFWLFVGTLAGLTPTPATNPMLVRVVAVAAMALVISVPFRARAGERAAHLEHLGTGVSQWQPAVDGERYREAGTTFALFLQADTDVVLPIRSALSSAVTVELRVNDRPIDAVVAPPGMWRQFRVHLPESESRYVKVDFRITEPPACQSCLWIGKALPVSRH